MSETSQVCRHRPEVLSKWQTARQQAYTEEPLDSHRLLAKLRYLSITKTGVQKLYRRRSKPLRGGGKANKIPVDSKGLTLSKHVNASMTTRGLQVYPYPRVYPYPTRTRGSGIRLTGRVITGTGVPGFTRTRI